LLELGTARRLLIAGETDEALPLDDTDLLETAKPITSVGTVNVEPASCRPTMTPR
jgi:hypothetical protein